MSGQKHISLDGVKFDRLRVADLRILCSERGLSEDGLKFDLVKRLTTWRKRKQRVDGTPCPGVPATPESLDTGDCQAIVVAEAEIGDDQHMISSAKKNLLEILEHDSLSVDRSTPTLTVGNSHGHAWATLPQRVQSLESETSSLREEVGLQKTTITSLQGQVTNLTLSVKAHELVRHRFLVNYKQNQLGVIDEEDKKYVTDGNSIVHGGDVKADAELYKDVTLPVRRRDDFPAFKNLTGASPRLMLTSSAHPETLNIINFHATVKSDSRQTPSTRFYELFTDFMKKFKASFYVTTYLDAGQDTLVTTAYWTFYHSLGSSASSRPVHPRRGQGD
ncbi:hypothetical protein HOY82DRAFT_481579 [Tuber indicum]|nr:hypothetical protein HOY82DRAFT_481579 [Tuber indicum]